MTGEFDYLLKPIRPDAPRDIMRKGATLTSPPPTPPERGGGSPRVRIEIEIVDRRGGPPPTARPTGYRLGRVAFWLIVLCLALALVGCAQAQTRWQSYRQGFNTITQGSDGSSARSYQQGFMRYTDITLPDGAVRHCQSYELSGTVHTECNE